MNGINGTIVTVKMPNADLTPKQQEIVGGKTICNVLGLKGKKAARLQQAAEKRMRLVARHNHLLDLPDSDGHVLRSFTIAVE